MNTPLFHCIRITAVVTALAFAGGASQAAKPEGAGHGKDKQRKEQRVTEVPVGSYFGDQQRVVVTEYYGRRYVSGKCPATEPEALWDMMQRMTSPYGGGLACYAISAIDLALWDLKGKLLRQPVYQLLGGAARSHVDCYATGNDVDWYLELGFEAFKLACPYGPADGARGLDDNEAFVAQARVSIGARRALMLDCWMAFNVDNAVALAERLAPYRLGWIEDCLHPEDRDGMRRMRERLHGVTLAGGEHWVTTAPFAACIQDRSLDILQPDIGWAGGMTGCLRIARMAEQAGLPVLLHAGANTAYGQHFSFAVANAQRAEYFVGSAPGVPLAEVALTPGTAGIVRGRLTPNSAPGFGLGLTPEAVHVMALT